MKDQIIDLSVECLRYEGLKFSVDTLAAKMKISKKTIYKYFPNKEALALAIYEKYYKKANLKVQAINQDNELSYISELLYLYFDSKMMTRKDIFNKYKLNEKIYSYASEQNNALWELISSALKKISEQNMETIKIIIDGVFEKLCNELKKPDAVIERLVYVL